MKSATGSNWSFSPPRLVRRPAEDLTAAACSRRTMTSRTERSPTFCTVPVTVTTGSLVVVTTSGVTPSMRTCRNGTEPGSPAAACGATAGRATKISSVSTASHRATTVPAPMRAVTALVRSRSSAGPAGVGLHRRDVGCGCASASGRACRGEVAGQRRQCRGTVVVQLVDQFARDFGQLALVGVGKSGGQLLQRHPGHLADLDVFVGELAAEEPHQVMVHGLVHPSALGDEPVVDAAERGQHGALDTGLLRDLADGGLLGGFTEFDVALGQRPQHAAAPVDAADEGSDLGFLGTVDAVDDKPARRCLVHGAQAFGPAPRRRGCWVCAAWVGRQAGCRAPRACGKRRRRLPTTDLLSRRCAVSGGPAARLPRRRPRRRRGLACSPSDTQAIVAATKFAPLPHSPDLDSTVTTRLIGRARIPLLTPNYWRPPRLR